MNTRMTASIVLALTSIGASATDYTDTAQVVSASPIIERVTEPRQECVAENAPIAQQQERSLTAPIVGGIAGAVLGSQVGRGSGKTAATAAGAVAGTIIGDRVANPESNRPITGAVIGGAAGGLLGAQVGRGSGRTAATAAGAIAGSVVGDRVENRQTAVAQPVQRCRTVETIREVVKGYSVVYHYNGRNITTTLPYNPGSTVRVGVGVIDEHPQAAAPAPGMRGTYVRDVSPPPPPPVAPVSAPPGESYPYRY